MSAPSVSAGSASRGASPALPVPLLLAGAAAAVLLAECFEPTAQIDDSYISYRYAKNLVAGHGLVFNPGEWVEGITNLLWTLCVAAGLALGVPAETAGHWLGVFSAMALLFATASLATAGLEGRTFTTSGMETHGFLALVTAALATQVRGHPRWAAAIVAVVLLIRPDAIVAAGVVLAWPLIEALRDGKRLSLHDFLPSFAVGLVAIALTLFRLGYYGSPIPNTFFAKVGGTPFAVTVETFRSYLLNGPALLIAPAVAVALRDRRAQLPLLFAAVCAAYVFAVGAPAGTFSRFLLPA